MQSVFPVPTGMFLGSNSEDLLKLFPGENETTDFDWYSHSGTATDNWGEYCTAASVFDGG